MFVSSESLGLLVWADTNVGSRLTVYTFLFLLITFSLSVPLGLKYVCDRNNRVALSLISSDTLFE